MHFFLPKSTQDKPLNTEHLQDKKNHLCYQPDPVCNILHTIFVYNHTL